MNRRVLLIPFILITVLSIVLWKALSLKPQELDSALIGKPFPEFSLTTLFYPDQTMSRADLVGEMFILNVWATWCPSCKQEHRYLMDLAQKNKISMVGLNYREAQRKDAIDELERFGNPYKKVLFDDKGLLGLDLGVYGAPETFIVDYEGIIRYRYAGILSSKVWSEKFLPIIEELKAKELQHNEKK